MSQNNLAVKEFFHNSGRNRSTFAKVTMKIQETQFFLTHCVYILRPLFVSQLLNHLDQTGTGPPPASKDEINALPTVDIIQEQVGQ